MDSGFPVSPNNSPLTEDDDTPTRGRRSRTTSANAGSNMSPIHESNIAIPKYDPDLNVISFNYKIMTLL